MEKGSGRNLVSGGGTKLVHLGGGGLFVTRELKSFGPLEPKKFPGLSRKPRAVVVAAFFS